MRQFHIEPPPKPNQGIIAAHPAFYVNTLVYSTGVLEFSISNLKTKINTLSKNTVLIYRGHSS
jgi:hypothetical protein